MNSCLFTAYVQHTRLMPVWHRLQYPLYVYCLDLDELESLNPDLIIQPSTPSTRIRVANTEEVGKKLDKVLKDIEVDEHAATIPARAADSKADSTDDSGKEEESDSEDD